MAPTLQKPQPGLLRIPTVPNFPLSSPITEEIDSPTSSPEDDKEMERQRPYEYLAKSSSQNPFFIHEPDINTSRSHHGSLGDMDSLYGAQKAEFVDDHSDLASSNQAKNMKRNPEKPVGLNLVTDFSLASSSRSNDVSAGPGPGPFLDLSDLKHLSKVREKERSVQRIKGILKKRTSDGFHKLQDDPVEQGSERSAYLDYGRRNSPAKKKSKEDLSPSDRPIMIGYSGPFDESNSQKDKFREPDSAGNQLTPLTPSIVVTPAKDDGFWGDSLSPEYLRPRVASSVYSQPTPCLMDGEVPPVPAIPAFHSVVSNGKGGSDLLQRRSVASRKQRAFSTGTLFEEDDSPQGAPGSRSRSYSNESVKRVLDRLSVNTDTNRHQSQGWWTYLLSPLLSRSPTSASRRTPTSARPPLPSLITTSSEPSNWWEKSPAREVSCFSPDTPETTLAGRGEVPSWQPTTGTNPFAELKSVNDEKYVYQQESQQGMPGLMFDGQTIQGEAAEYYQACAHELFSGTPYFECINHVCSITPKNKIPVIIPDENTQPQEGEKGLAIFAGAEESHPEANAQPQESEKGLAIFAAEESPHSEEKDKTLTSPVEKDKAAAAPSPTTPSTDPQTAVIQKIADAIFSTVRQMHAPKEETSASKEDAEPVPKGVAGPPTPIAKDSPMPQPPVQEPQPQPQPQPVPEVSLSEKQAPESFNQPGLTIPPPVTHIYYQPAVHPAPIPAPIVAPAPVPAPVFEPAPAPLPPVAQVPAPAPAPAPAFEPNPAPAPVHEPIPRSEPIPEPAPAPAPAAAAPAERAAPQYLFVDTPNYGGQRQPPGPDSPGPMSPAYQQATERSGPGGVSLNELPLPRPAFAAQSHPHHSFASSRRGLLPITAVDMSHPVTEQDRIDAQRRQLEKDEKAYDKSKSRSCSRIPGLVKKCFGRKDKEGKKKRRWYCAICLFFLIIVIIAILLAILLTRKGGDDTSIQSQWLNLTGYPPMPTGISTIAGPEPQVQRSGCIAPTTLWSCALPKEDQDANKPYTATEPDFRVQIRFRNGTYSHSTTLATRSEHLLRSRSSGNGSFDPSPSPPSIADQTFLGNTTDKNDTPYAGEETPFYISILSSISASSSASAARLARRSSDPFPNLTALIPDPDFESDGTAAPANLYPFPESQPIRLYNRGKETEHYGFYSYFDRSIFLESNAPLTGNGTDNYANDKNGGSSKQDARVRCTWAQTRFLVQIWTKPASSGKQLLSPSPSASATSTATATKTSETSSSQSTASSATDWTRPGSFPYPVTITLDRHGGAANKKMVYCYGMEGNEKINSTEVKLQVEERGYDGTLINPAPGIFSESDSSSNSTDTDTGYDGGTGGCECQWTNWVSTY